MRIRRTKLSRGFTLVELLIYMAIVSVVLVLALGFIWDIIHGYTKADSGREAQQNGRLALAVISAEIKGADSIISPSVGSSGQMVSLATNNSSTNPTVIDLSAGKLRITRGPSGPYDLTSSEVIVTNLQFFNFSYVNTPGTIKVEMDIVHVNAGNRQEYVASSSFKSSISLRR